jgi:hypothetical protein
MFNSFFFVFFVFFITKPNNSLRFCIDYYKLNNLTRKDQYLFSLINKTLV